MIKNINRVNYITNMKYVSGIIREYDISKANISVLLAAKKIDIELYNKLFIADKLHREIYIGNLIKKDKSYDTAIKNGILHYKELFYESNGIEDQDIISIHNDSLFLLNKTPSTTVFDDIVEFKFKGSYICFWKIFSLEIYYYYGMISNEERIEIKGINDSRLVLHESYFLDFLKALFLEREMNDIESALDILKSFSKDYLDRTLDPNYYREFNPNSMFNFGNGYYSEYCLPSQLQYIDITYNNYILRELFSILSVQYFNRK